MILLSFETISMKQHESSLANWGASELNASNSWMFDLDDQDRAEIESALGTMKSSGVSNAEMRFSEFPLVRMLHKIDSIRNELENGTGVVLLRGLPVQRYDEMDCARIYFGLGMHLGSAMAQNPSGDLLGHVRDEGRDWKVDPTARAYQTTSWLPFHTDPGDVVGLLCLRTAKSGGLSSIASATAIHDYLATERPDLLKVLYQSFFYDSRGQEPAGAAPWQEMPVFDESDHGITCFFVREYIESAQRFNDVPRLTGLQREALGTFEALSVDDRFRVDMAFQPGDIQLLNNHVVLHSRTGFEDYVEQEKKRHLLRLWLKLPAYQKHPAGYQQFIGRLESWPKRQNAFSQT